MARVCAYCGSRGRLTREHLFPSFLEKLMPTYSVNLSSARRGKMTGPTTIRDVCERCSCECGELRRHRTLFVEVRPRLHLRRQTKPPNLPSR
jgi:hypothetical protein